MEWVGVLIGNEGETRRRLEEATGAHLEINSQTGDVTIHEGSQDPSLALKLRDAVAAIGRGFSEERALRLRT
jgi:ribosomal RNA assembly protein